MRVTALATAFFQPWLQVREIEAGNPNAEPRKKSEV
jgi:hypothetical protein